MATSYRRPARTTSGYKDIAAPYNTAVSGNIQPGPNLAGKKLLDQFRDKMRSLHYALATEKSYRQWIIEFLRFHRVSGRWRHPAEMGKPEIEAFLTHLATDRKVSASTQNQAFSAILFLYKQVLKFELPMIVALRAGEEKGTGVFS